MSKKEKPETPNIDMLIRYLGQGFTFKSGPPPVGMRATCFPEREPSVSIEWFEPEAMALISELATLLKTCGRENVCGLPLDWLTTLKPTAKKARRRVKK